MRIDGRHAVLLEPPRLGVACGGGPVVLQPDMAQVAWVLVEGGEGELHLADARIAVRGRDTVFDGAGWSALLAPGAEAVLAGDLRWTVVWRALDGRTLESRVLAPDDVIQEHRGDGSCARLVRTYLPEGALIAGETVNPPGGWSSYPPHRHEQEEVYLYRFAPPHGFGVTVEYDDDRNDARMVRDGSVQRIRRGYHPVVAAPAAAMAYVWVLAGDHDVLTPEFDPAFGA